MLLASYLGEKSGNNIVNLTRSIKVVPTGRRFVSHLDGLYKHIYSINLFVVKLPDQSLKAASRGRNHKKAQVQAFYSRRHLPNCLLDRA